MNINTSTRIKNLSIALEALSRIKGADRLFEEISSLLLDELTIAHKENKPKLHPQTQLDDIPF